MNKRHYEHTLPNIRGSLSNLTFLHGFILLQAKVTYIYKDKILWTRKHTDSCTRRYHIAVISFFSEGIAMAVRDNDR